MGAQPSTPPSPSPPPPPAVPGEVISGRVCHDDIFFPSFLKHLHQCFSKCKVLVNHPGVV